MMFEDFVRAHGLLPGGSVIPDGRWHRCPTADHPRKRNGSFKLAQDARAGWCQDFAAHASPLMWRPDGDDALPVVDFAGIARRHAEAQAASLKATAGARQFYASCAPLRGGHPYLESHGLTMAGCLGLRIDRAGSLVVPALLNGKIMSVQTIAPDGIKKFWTGAPAKGASYTIDRPGASITVLCEGLATGLAIFAAAPLTRVVAAFNTGNMPRVQMPAGLVVVAADNDHKTAMRIGRNPGVLAAQEAATALGCGVAVPEGIVGSDWCDFRNERVADRLATRYRERETDIRRAVDAQIAAAMSRNATFRRLA